MDTLADSGANFAFAFLIYMHSVCDVCLVYLTEGCLCLSQSWIAETKLKVDHALRLFCKVLLAGGL